VARAYALADVEANHSNSNIVSREEVARRALSRRDSVCRDTYIPADAGKVPLRHSFLRKAEKRQVILS
jgi:hypothetical protein